MTIDTDTDVTTLTIDQLTKQLEELDNAIPLLEKRIEDEEDEIEEHELECKLDELQNYRSEVEDRIENQLWIVIDDEIMEVDRVITAGYLPSVESGKYDYHVAESSEDAGAAARKYWEDMAENDPKEFTCMIGEETLIQWGLGRYAGPGSTQVQSLEEWLDLWLDTPEEQWASYDGAERDVDFASKALVDELKFLPTVAYRHN